MGVPIKVNAKNFSIKWNSANFEFKTIEICFFVSCFVLKKITENKSAKTCNRVKTGNIVIDFPARQPDLVEQK